MRRRGWATVACGLLATVVFAASAQAQVVNGQSGWEWGTPTPQGNAINDIGFIGGVGYAVGNFGTIMSTTDAGQSWTGLNTGITADINKVALPAPGTIIIGGGCYDLISANGGVSFTQMQFTVPGPNCSPTVTSQSFVSPAVGYVLANTGQVLATNDAGATFSGNSAPVPGTAAAGGGATATDIAFTTATNGVALVGGSIFRTTNGAGSWTSVHTGGQALNSVVFIDNNNGFAVGASSTVLKTTDGGATWTDRSNNLPDIPASSIKVLPNGGLILATDLAAFYRAPGQGTWKRLGTGLPVTVGMDIEYFAGNNTVYLATHGRGIWSFNLSQV